MGTDHAGIATQMVVERQLNRQGITRLDLGREAFIEKVWEWKAESGENIARQLRRLGASLDWDSQKFTLDPDISTAVREVFIRLYEEGLIYRGKKLVNWDPSLLTAISDLEVINDEVEGKLWYIRYPIVDSDQQLIVATTRPETMLGDVAIAVHPNDPRYISLIGKQVHLPLTDRTIPVIADTYVDATFGTGCVKITPAHDFNDYEVGKRHALTPINIFTPNAHLNENVPAAYRGLERFAARKKILADLTDAQLIEKIDKHMMKIPRGERSGVIVEPYLTSQWFMKMDTLAKPAIDIVKNNEVQFVPENWSKTYFQWMENIQDWCISRQLWWGHRIPVWYDNNQHTYVGQNEQDVRQKYNLNADVQLTQDNDVLDTWFSSALWPFTTMGWPELTSDLKTFYPNNLLVTGFDIIFFWVARMIMMGLKFMDQAPFKEIYITGLIRDAEGHKMSKSKGNVLDPIDLIDGIDLEALLKKRTYGLMQPEMAKKIEKNTRKEFPEGIPSYGTDALRFTFCSNASYTREIRFDTNRLAGYRNFCNKLWNASRYVLMNVKDHDILKPSDDDFTIADRWIIARLHQTIANVRPYLAPGIYRFDLLAQTLYDFTWNEFCDWYLELSKPLLTSDGLPNAINATRYTLVYVLETLLRLLHPIIPFITEEIWQRVVPFINNDHAQSIMYAPYPDANASLVDHDIIEEVEWLKTIITRIRTMRSEMNISPAKNLPILLRNGKTKDQQYINKHISLIKTLSKLSSIDWLDKTDNLPLSISAFVGDLEIYLPMESFINKEEELARINKEILKLQKELTQINTKLNNQQFVERAPAAVLHKEKERLESAQLALNKLQVQQGELMKLND